MTDKLANPIQRFLFENDNVRGEICQITRAFADIIGQHQYPPAVSRLLGELMAATALLTATLKFEGEISIQLQGNGPVPLLVINGNHRQVMKGVARVKGELKGERLADIVGDKAFLVITIKPDKGERYQGVIEVEQPSLAACIEQYFLRSEQLPTRLWLFADDTVPAAAGLLLQILPQSAAPTQQQEAFDHLATLAATLTANEMLHLDSEKVLFRLFHQEQVRLFPPQNISYRCSCSQEKCLETLASLDPAVIEEELTTKGYISMRCEYCLTDYRFDRDSLRQLKH